MSWLEQYITRQSAPPSEYSSVLEQLINGETKPSQQPRQGILQQLTQTWPARMVQGAWNAAQLPGDVYAGRTDPMSDDAVARSFDLAGSMIGSTFGAPAGVLGSGMTRPYKPQYPMAPRDRWYGDANFQQTGGQLTHMTPDEFLAKARPMKIDEVAQDNIDDLVRHVRAGGELDPLAIYKNGKEDGRHRAHAAKILGIDKLPVLIWPTK